MTITITYSAPQELRPKAARLAIAIENSFGLKPGLAPVAADVFEVAVDGHLVYSKRPEDDLAETSEIVELIRAHVKSLTFH